MSETEPKLADVLATNRTDMATERTRMGADRTLMAWIRTALSLISFGFTIYKFLETMAKQSKEPLLRPRGPQEVGLTLIGIGIFALIVACIQHWRFMKKLRPDQPVRPWDLSFVIAFMIGLLGLVMFVSMIFRIGPLG
jgi:putative membrane protein